jgi:hypothetical protein
VTDDPGVPGSADPTDIVVGLPAPAIEVPGLSGAGVIGLALLLAASGLVALRRQPLG